jgi:hypothetical protein
MLDHLSYPHIFDLILSFADDTTLMRLRTTSSDVRVKADSLLFEHVVVSGAILNEDTPMWLLSPSGSRLPMDPSASDGLGANAVAALSHTAVMDCYRLDSARTIADGIVKSICPAAWRFYSIGCDRLNAVRAPTAVYFRAFKPKHPTGYCLPQPSWLRHQGIGYQLHDARTHVIHLSYDPHDPRLRQAQVEAFHVKPDSENVILILDRSGSTTGVDFNPPLLE